MKSYCIMTNSLWIDDAGDSDAIYVDYGLLCTASGAPPTPSSSEPILRTQRPAGPLAEAAPGAGSPSEKSLGREIQHRSLR